MNIPTQYSFPDFPAPPNFIQDKVPGSTFVRSKQIKHELTIIPKLAIHPNQINIYNEVQWSPHKPQKYDQQTGEKIHVRKFEHLLTSKRSAEGNVSVIAKRKMMKALNYMLMLTSEKTIHNNYSGRNFKFKLAFITLTLPSVQIHTDNEIKKECLNQILIELRENYDVRFYIWRAEKQKNGNIHFHILIDKFIPHQELRDRWNRIINKLGYVDTYRETQQAWHNNGFQVRKELLKTWTKEKQYQAYLRGAKTHWNSPNSTDIHSIFKINNIKLYIAKYLTKNEINKLEENLKDNLFAVPQGRIWGCSQLLSKVKGAQTEIDTELQDTIEDLINEPGVRIINDKYFSVIFFDSELLFLPVYERLFLLFSRFLVDHFHYNLQKEFSI
jgi:hypothetical protein